MMKKSVVAVSLLVALACGRTNQEYLEVFQEYARLFSLEEVIEFRHAPNLGIYGVAARNISKGDIVLEIPCSYILGVCKT